LWYDISSSELNKPAREVFAHKLDGELQTAITKSNAQYDDPDVVNRLAVRLLKASDGDVGWDVFSLDYNVKSPINVLFTKASVNKYLRLFNFLWRIKRVEHELTLTWSQHATHDLRLRLLPQLNGMPI
jgi:gamma-tubulin complex component 3